jgi:hypothetical protein
MLGKPTKEIFMAMTTKTLDKTQAIHVIYEFFKHFQKCINQSIEPNLAELEQYITKNFQITSSGHPVAKSSADYLKRLQNFQKKHSKWEISKPLEEPLVQDNRITLFYKVNLTSKTGEKKEVYIMAIGTIEDNKIRSWNQVAHEQGTGSWDK